jgi:Family of unknown function (DUF6171)
VSCEKCPCPTTCLQRPSFCEWAKTGERSKLDHICMRSALGETPIAPSFPPVATQIGNAVSALGRATGQILSGGKLRVDDAEFERRMTLCRACDQYRGVRCAVCGCVAKLKARLQSETGQCPLGKW